MESTVFRKSRFHVHGDRHVEHRVERQHHHDVRDAHFVVRRHGHRDVVPRQPGPYAFEHDETLEYVTQCRVGKYGRR